ncbi:MAG: zf-HC2 domain-containing protein [Ignavibacteria bacterium]|nr:zf-HC2 domain-containing protein [Ignavibacteria bacterium]
MHRIHRHTANCRNVAKHVQEQLDYGLSSGAYRKIKEHLERCPKCTAYLDSLKKTVFLYQRYPDPHVPKRMRQRLFAVLNLH